jgi:hypothetical protein
VNYPSLPLAETVALQFQLAQRRSYSSTEFPVSTAIASTSYLALGLHSGGTALRGFPPLKQVPFHRQSLIFHKLLIFDGTFILELQQYKILHTITCAASVNEALRLLTKIAKSAAA